MQSTLRSGNLLLLALLAVALILASTRLSAQTTDPCGPDANVIVCENSKPGTPSNEWDILNNGDESIQGFATNMSVNAGETIGFKVDTDASDYSLLIYRMGWYGGDGARLIDTLQPFDNQPRNQPACLLDEPSNLIDCGNWSLSASWDVPVDAVAGVYIARLIRTDTGGDSHIIFVVRNDSRSADLLFQTSDTTWQAYNAYGGSSTYTGGPNGRAYKVSYNRPMWSRGGTPDGRDSFFGSEYAMIRWLERNGYDVNYLSGVDTDRGSPAILLNHGAFVSVGHDEYWSGTQRENVEAARDAGVNLLFLSGNEVYWKHRWEPAIDGSGDDHRTLVVYKETRANAKIDPSSEWTGTWRDPRFSPPSDGGRPENSLTGTLFTVNCCTYSMRVPAEYGNLRFWRDTRVAELTEGEEAVFPMGTLGYEWDEDIDNGFRPPGVFRMSRTTEIVQERLIDYGSTVAVEEATHHLMMYRAESGALVFGAGTVQWSWGLDDYHDGMPAPVEPAMQQATVNVLADMGIQPQSLEAGLLAATASTDSEPPAVQLLAPADGQVVTHGRNFTISGTATDVGGGVVAAVEVSVNNGESWHPAQGRDTWSYTGASTRAGTQTVLARAVDDSGNLGLPVARDIIVNCPCRLFGEHLQPVVASFDDTSQLELGVKFQSAVDGWITGVRFYKGPSNTGTHTGSLWNSAGELLASGVFTNESSQGWQEMTFGQPVAIVADTVYIASYHAPNGGYAGNTDWFATTPTLSPPLSAPPSTAGDSNGVYAIGPAQTFPTQSYRSSNYWVDVLFSEVAPPDNRGPVAISSAPIDDASSVPVSTTVSVEFDEPVDSGSLVFTLVDQSGNPVAGAVLLDSTSRIVSFTPQPALAFAERYTLSVSVSDLAGNPMAAPLQLSFVTSLPDGSFGALWTDSAIPGTVDAADSSAIELGLKFTADSDLDITGIRFYKSADNAGPHVGSLWDTSGNLLARADFTTTSASGWQQADFAEAVRTVAGETYVASYFAPSGRYAADGGYFSTAAVSGALRAPASSTSGGNGVYRYTNAPAFPSDSYNSTNYWVTPVYVEPPDIQPPRLVSTSPVDGASSVPADAAITAFLNEAIDPASLTFLVTDANGAPIAGAVSVDADTSSATFTPDTALAAGVTHTASLSAADLLGNATESPLSFAFTVASDATLAALWDDTDAPATPDSGDGSAIEVGTAFIPETDLFLTGIRFYKAVTNTGTHIGSLWNAQGNRLAQITFENESSTGWQQANLAAPVELTAGNVYIVSYFAPDGHYSATPGFFQQSLSRGAIVAPADSAGQGNGVYAYSADSTFPSSSYNGTNYWVTPVYEVPPDVQAASVLSFFPEDGESSVPVDTVIQVRFDEPVDAQSTTLLLTDPDGNPVAGTTTFSDTLMDAELVPAQSLTAGSRYQLEVNATDAAGNSNALPFEMGFSTATDIPVPGLWNDTDRPDILDSNDPGSIEVGTKFTAQTPVDITGVRFFKAAANTGTHSVSLWSQSGTRLAQATLSSQSTAGWQQARFDQPVRIDAGDVYIVSYFAPNGHYSATAGFFSAAHTVGPLTAPGSSQVDGNGVYAYSSTSVFPGTASASNASYWVTPLFAYPPDTTPPAVVSTTPVDGASSVSINTPVTVTFDEAVDMATLALSVEGELSGPVSGAIAYDSGDYTIIFTPDSPLAMADSFDVVAQVTDLAGNPLTQPVNVGFSTALPDGSVTALWDDSAVPDLVDANDENAIELGVKFIATLDLDITGLRFYKSVANSGPHTGSLWDASGNLLAQTALASTSAVGWQDVEFLAPVRITAGDVYVASYFAPSGHYSSSGGYFYDELINGPLRAPPSGEVDGNGVYAYSDSPTFPTDSYNDSNYWVTPTYRVPDDIVLPGDNGAGLWDLATIPATVDSGDPGAIELGVSFTAAVELDIAGVRFYKSAANTGPHVGSLWDETGTLLAQAEFGPGVVSGWRETLFDSPVRISAGQTYVISYHAPNGHYSATGGYYNNELISGSVTVPAGSNGRYNYGSGGFPVSSYNNTNYWVTPVYTLP